MSKCTLYFVLFLGALTSVCAQDGPPLPEQLAQYGTEFIFSVPPCYEQGGADNQIVVFVSSPFETRVRIEIPGRGIVKTLLTVPNDNVFFSLSPAEAQPFNKNPNQPAPQQDVYAGAGLILRSDAPIMATLMVRFQFTTDGTTLLPTSVLGNEYVVGSMADMSAMYPGFNLPSETVITAIANDTQVWFTLGGNAETGTNNSMSPGDTRGYTLQRGDVLAIATVTAGGDLSGSYVRSTKPVSVVSGNQCANVPIETRWCDYIVSSEIPLTSWGRNYHVPMPVWRENNAILKVFAAEGNTTVKRNGEEFLQIETAKGGQEGTGYYSGPVADGEADVYTFSADKPIGIKYYNRGQEDDNISTDPFAVQLLPVEQYVTYMRFHTPGVAQLSFAMNRAAIIYAVDEDGIVPEDLEYAIVNNGEFEWRRIRDTFGSTPGAIFPSIGDGKTWAQKTIMLPDPSGVYIMRSGSEPFMVYLDGVNTYDSYGIHNSTGLRDLTSDDEVPPINKTTGDTGNSFSGIVQDVAQAGSVPVGLAQVYALPNAINNMTFTVLDFIPGTDAEVPWSAVVDDPAMFASITIVMVDRRGNYDTFQIDYEPEMPPIEVDPILLDFGDLVATMNAEREFTISNTSFIDAVNINSISFENQTAGYEFVNLPGIPLELPPRVEGSDAHSATFKLRWTAPAPGQYLDRVMISVNNDPDEGYTRLQAQSIENQFVIPDLDASSVAVGESEVREVSFVNGSNFIVEILSISTPTDPVFSFVDPEADLGGLPVVMSANTLAEVRLEFSPTEVQPYSASFDVTYRFEGGLPTVETVNLTGVGVDPVSSVDEDIISVFGTELLAQPNPASSAVTVNFNLLTSERLAVQLIDVRGNVVQELPQQMFGAGRQSVKLDVSELAVGNYYCRLEAGGSTAILPLVIQR